MRSHFPRAHYTPVAGLRRVVSACDFESGNHDPPYVISQLRIGSPHGFFHTLSLRRTHQATCSDPFSKGCLAGSSSSTQPDHAVASLRYCTNETASQALPLQASYGLALAGPLFRPTWVATRRCFITGFPPLIVVFVLLSRSWLR